MSADGAPIERITAMVLALFDEDDCVSHASELVSDDRTAGPRAHDHDITFDVSAAPVVRPMDLAKPSGLVDANGKAVSSAGSLQRPDPIEVHDLDKKGNETQRTA
jgi:hypothetical protein